MIRQASQSGHYTRYYPYYWCHLRCHGLDAINRRHLLSAAQRVFALSRGGTPPSLWLFLQLASHLEVCNSRDQVDSILSMAKTGCEKIGADYELPLATVDASCAKRFTRYLAHLRTNTTSMSAVHGSKQ